MQLEWVVPYINEKWIHGCYRITELVTQYLYIHMGGKVSAVNALTTFRSNEEYSDELFRAVVTRHGQVEKPWLVSNGLTAFAFLIPVNGTIFHWNGSLAIAKSSALHEPFPPYALHITVLFTHYIAWQTDHHLTGTAAFTSCQWH